MAPDAVYIAFVFMLGACVGSFLNVVVWRLPRGERLDKPPSHCPKCGRFLRWYDNVPILGWIKLRGRCRFCKEPISARYPIVEAVTALLFVSYFLAFRYTEFGPWPPVRQPVFDTGGPAYLHVRVEWPVYFLYVFLASALLAASLIDAELFIIPAKIPWTVAGVALVFHAAFDHPNVAGALNAVAAIGGGPSPTAALAAGGGVGLLVSLALWYAGRLPVSFPEGEPMLEVDREAARREAEEAARKGEDPPPVPPAYTRGQIRREMRKEMAFLLPPMAVAVAWYVLTTRVPSLHVAWTNATRPDWVTGILGALFGGLVGGFVVWITRILGTLGFGRVAMGLGDVDLMFAVGTVLGAGAATVAFFLAPFFGIALALYMLLTGQRRELPYGPYLSLASGFAMLFYGPIADWLAPGLAGLGYFLGGG